MASVFGVILKVRYLVIIWNDLLFSFMFSTIKDVGVANKSTYKQYCQISYIVKSLIWVTPNPEIYMFLILSCSGLCAILCQVLSREWRCSCSNADRQCSNYIWVINNSIAYYDALILEIRRYCIQFVYSFVVLSFVVVILAVQMDSDGTKPMPEPMMTHHR